MKYYFSVKARRAMLFLPVILAAAAVFSGCAGTRFQKTARESGLYEASARGYRGDIRLKVLVSPAGIEEIEIVEHSEDEAVGGAAMEELREKILENGGVLGIDAVSGATASSRGFLEAVEKAIGS